MRKLLVVFVALSMALAATTYALWHGRENERARADALQARIAIFETRRPATPVFAPPQTGAAAPDAAEPPAAQVAFAPPSDEADDDYARYMARRRELLRDPKYYAAAHASMRSMFDERRYWMIRTLGLSAAKADEIIDYYIDLRLRDETIVWNPQASEQEQREHQALLAQRRSDDSERLRAIAGEETFAKLEEFTASHPSRNRTNQLRNRLDAGNDAMRDDQIEPLIAVFHTEQTRYMQETQEYIEAQDPDNISPEILHKRLQHIDSLANASNRRIRTSASMILSSRQLAELDAMLRAEREVAQAQMAMHEMDQGAGGD
jgi:hypothetical protein